MAIEVFSRSDRKAYRKKLEFDKITQPIGPINLKFILKNRNIECSNSDVLQTIIDNLEIKETVNLPVLVICNEVKQTTPVEEILRIEIQKQKIKYFLVCGDFISNMEVHHFICKYLSFFSFLTY